MVGSSPSRDLPSRLRGSCNGVTQPDLRWRSHRSRANTGPPMSMSRFLLCPPRSTRVPAVADVLNSHSFTSTQGSFADVQHRDALFPGERAWSGVSTRDRSRRLDPCRVPSIAPLANSVRLLLLSTPEPETAALRTARRRAGTHLDDVQLCLIHISEPTRRTPISY